MQPIRRFDYKSQAPFYIAHNGNIPNLENHDTSYLRNILEDGSQDLYDIIKFCCAIKENPESPNFKEWSRKASNAENRTQQKRSDCEER